MIHDSVHDTKNKYKNLNLIQIVANEDLGGILELNQVKAKKNIKLGYYDTLKAFHAYDGTRYYIKTAHKEAFFLKQFIMMKKANLEVVMISLGNRSSIKQYGILSFDCGLFPGSLSPIRSANTL